MLLSCSIFLLSASVLYYEIIVIRLLALSHWQPFVTLGLSTALLGFGMSGTILIWTGDLIFPRRRVWYPLLAAVTALSLRPVLDAASNLRLEPGLIIRDPAQWLYLGLLITILFIPFTLASLAMALPLLEKETVGKYYGWNLSGACAGIMLALAAMEYLEPSRLAVPGAAICLLACSTSLAHYSEKPLVSGIISAAVLTPFTLYPSHPLSFGPYKDISYARLLPESRIMFEEWGANGLLQAVGAPSLRSASGLSLRYSGGLPDQGLLYRDGDRAGTLIMAENETDKDLEYLKWQTSAAPYSILDSGAKVVLVGFDGGEEVARARLHQAAKVSVVEPDRSLATAVEEHPEFFRGWIYSPDVVAFIPLTARAFFSSRVPDADAVIFPLSGNMASTSAGISGAAENYELTVEGVKAVMSYVSSDGLIAIAGWNQAPPTGRWKIINLLKELPSLSGDDGTADRVCLVTSWSTHIFLIKKRGFTEAELALLGTFCDRRGFSLARGEELSSLGGGPGWKSSNLRGLSLDLRPPTDNRPYPWHTLKAKSLRFLVGGTREEVFPRIEWSFLFLIMTLALSGASALVLLVLSRPGRSGAGSPASSFIYFSCLGLGYLVVEVLLVKRAGIVFAPPAVAAAFVLAPFLLFSGIGSHAAGRMSYHPVRIRAVFVLIVPCVLGAYATPGIMAAAPGPVKLFLTTLALAPAAFLMGMPFPLALKHFSGQRETLVPWAWSISGYMSVIGSSLAGVLAVTKGFHALFLFGGACYLCAALLFDRAAARGP